VPRLASPATAQRFLVVHGAVFNAFNLRGHLIACRSLSTFRVEAMEQWQLATAAA
jgi:putative transposase